MKKYLTSACVTVALLFAAGPVIAQAPRTSPDLNAVALVDANKQLKQLADALAEMKANNQLLIDKQKKTLEQLEALRKEADQVRFLGRRN